jgi:hypothetical protein
MKKIALLFAFVVGLVQAQAQVRGGINFFKGTLKVPLLWLKLKTNHFLLKFMRLVVLTVKISKRLLMLMPK